MNQRVRVVVWLAAIATFFFARDLWLTIVAALVFIGLSLSMPFPPPDSYWRFFNVGLRLAGIWFAFCGLGILAWGVVFLIRPEETSGMTTLSGSAVIDAALIGIFVAALGFVLLRRRAYRPDLGDHPLSDRAYGLLLGLPRNWSRPKAPLADAPRSWWTGEPAP